jgi:hypothetical protein
MPRYFVAPVSFGLGDLVVSLPVIQAVVNRSHGIKGETWLVARSHAQRALAERIPGLIGVVDEGFLTTGRSDELIDLRDHPLQRDYWWGSPEFEAAVGPMFINEIVGRIAADFGIIADFSAPVPLYARPRLDAADLVILVADAHGTAKQWPTECWVSLTARLRQAGFGVAAITQGRPDHHLVAKGVAEIAASTPGDAVDVLSGCRAVIGVDTGLTHIAVQQGTPAVTISRKPAVYYREWAHTRLVAGTFCDPGCQRAENEYGQKQRARLDPDAPPRVCPSRASCLRAIGPDTVMKALEELC